MMKSLRMPTKKLRTADRCLLSPPEAAEDTDEAVLEADDERFNGVLAAAPARFGGAAGLPFSGFPVSGDLAGVGRGDFAAFATAFQALTNSDASAATALSCTLRNFATVTPTRVAWRRSRGNRES